MGDRTTVWCLLPKRPDLLEVAKTYDFECHYDSPEDPRKFFIAVIPDCNYAEVGELTDLPNDFSYIMNHESGGSYGPGMKSSLT